MIRDFMLEDLEELSKLIIRSDILDEIDIPKDISSQAKKFVIYDENPIKGFAYAILQSEKDKEWNIQVYVDIKERRKGIGTALYSEILEFLKNEEPEILVTEFRVDINDSTPFFLKHGFKKWYGCPNLTYTGSYQPDIDISFVNYEDKYYENYAKVRQECFYELRKNNDFKPYLIPLSEEDRARFLKDKDFVYIALANDEILASVIVKDGYLDNVIVSPKYQGMGYGKKLVQFAINKALSQGMNPVNLLYIEGNEKAAGLYKSLGFETKQIIDVHRKFLY